MKPTVTIDTSEFQAALKRHLATTKRELSEALNMRMAAVLMRTFLILAPRDPQAKRQAVRAELTREIEERTYIPKTGASAGKPKRKGKSRQFQSRHAILQWLRAKAGKPGLYGEKMRVESGKFLGQRTSSVGAMKALVVKMIRGVMPAFTQFGMRTKKHNGRQVQPNAMLVRLASQYNHSANNVGVARNAKIAPKKARPGTSASVQVSGWLGVDNGQEGRVEGRYNMALARAFSDETWEMKRHMEAVVLDNAEASGFKVT